ncbi:neuraminidase-like domain-containing protein [Pseudomonas cichorii]|uniref:Tc toxin subunit A-related protein n=1 Tax=Pseudomonas cichorii TaxID=36746 RepID=UPI001C890DDE|nr:neuraminidase-like domain-containing protein [Pseudomonas cichorii]MBX8572985.1 toxin [Pseudomonas cichorii]
MSRSIESQLNESFRDALVTYYLGEVVPNSPLLRSLGLDQRLKNANDLYEFFLIDNQVINDVETSYVASAIGSIQQFINGALMGMEPGYDLLRPTEANFVEWRERSSQYPIWAANMQLALYPETFISPALRMKKSGYFENLENDINQNKISIDTTQEAVKSYLASFEEVANLTVINGYIDTERFAEGKYYFIGKSRAENIYYWRTVDMNERAYKEGTEGPKHDYPTPGAWSDWKRAEIGVNANTIERTLRPVFFNNRLFVTWVDMIPVSEEIEITLPTGSIKPNPDGSIPITPAPPPTSTPKVRLLFNVSYKKYDDSWSAPLIYMDVTSLKIFTRANKTVNLENDLHSIAVFDISASPESLFIAIYAGETPVSGDTDGSTSDYALLETAFIDKNFNKERAFPKDGFVLADYDPVTAEPNESRIRKTCWALALKNKGNFQFTWKVHVAFKTVKTTSPNPENQWWNIENLQNKVVNMEANNPPTIDHARSTLRFTTAINSDIRISSDAVSIQFIHLFLGLWKLTLIVQPHNDTFLKLQKGSTLSVEPMFSGESRFLLYLLINNEQADLGLMDFLFDPTFKRYNIKTTPGEITSVDLDGGYIKRRTIDILLHRTEWDPAQITSGYVILLDNEKTYTCITICENLEGHTNYTLNQEFKIPTKMSSPYDTQIKIKYSAPTDSLTSPSVFTIDIPFDKSTLLPKLEGTTFIENQKKFYITHGIGVDHKSSGDNAGSAIKSTEIELTWESEGGVDPIAPKINKRTDPLLGIAEYIDFSASTIKFSDGSTDDKRDPIRMNTLFARELINKANIALEALLSWGTQQLPEPPIGEESAPSKMDFKGANGLYFWELFLHLPFMISYRLNLEQRFNEAEFWLGFIFDPGRKENSSTGAPDYWNVRPLTELPDPDYFMRAPIDPDGIAASDPVRYQKAVYFHYIKNLIDRGDMAYRQVTPDSLGEAKLWYVRILDLLGPRPDAVITSQWTPIKLGSLAAASNPGLRAFETQLIQQEQQVRDSAAANDGKAVISFTQPSLRLSTSGYDPTLVEEDNGHFIVPMNTELTKYWDMVESRLYNLRHNLTLDGKPLSLPLFAAPLDPRALLAAYANGATEGGAGSLLAQETPHYRYAVMFNRASNAVDNLIQFGNTLLSIIERKEQGQLMELQQQLAWKFAQYAIDLQLEAQKVEIEMRKALEANKAIAEARASFYGKLADENVTRVESDALAAHMVARVASGGASVSKGVAAALKPVPNHLGVHSSATVGYASGAATGGAGGGFQLEGIPEMVAIGAEAIATLEDSVGTALERTEVFRRRLQEWENARDQAKLESEHMTAQLAVHDAQTRVTALQLRQSQEAKKQAEVVYAFLNKRFTNSQLYQWLNGQFSTFYYQAYDATFSLCLAAQACWQYEIADYATTFIKPAAWKDAWRGLTAGEALKLNLLRMDAAYLARNDRKQEIVKTVSVKQLPVSTEEDPSINLGWDAVLARLADENIAEFEITRAMLDADYPGHHLRRIKRVSVSLPVTLGPYQDIRATLTQTYNAVQMNGPQGAPKENMRASQQIAVSTGVDDDGLFVFNFDDERYLPFEGTGAISRWALKFSARQEDMIASITDIILHLRYTAKSS